MILEISEEMEHDRGEVINFGCRLNAFESQVIKDQLQQGNHNNVVVFNTCSVTSEAERQARQAIRKYKKNNPDVKIIVTGCSAQVNPKQYETMAEVDKVLGNIEKLAAKNYNLDGEYPRVLVNDIMSIKESASHMVNNFDGRSRAFIEVQNGCDHRCTFCIIPFGRGNNRSVPMGDIVNNIKELVLVKGYNEIVLTGVDITAYGGDLPGNFTLGNLVERILKNVPELKRLRLSSVDVAEIDVKLMELLKHEPRLMPYLHISLQSGDNLILKRMKRRHLREDVINFCNELRQHRKDVAFGADIIAGFPTETDEMFNNSLKLVQEANIQFLHVFPYSARSGTPAAKMPQVKKEVRKQRAALLRQEGELLLSNFLQQFIGRTLSAVVEHNNQARAENFATIEFEGQAEAGTIVAFKILSANNGKLQAVINN